MWGAILASAWSREGEAQRADTGMVPAVVTVTATDYAFEAPDTLLEGWTTFHAVNRGGVLHAPLLVKLGEGRTVNGFREAYADAWNNGGPWDRLGLLGGIVAPPPGGQPTSATLYLSAGHYAWYCPMHWEGVAPHLVEHGMARPFVVASRGGSEPLPSAPEPSLTISMLDYAFSLSAPPTAGHHVIRVENHGREGHEVVLVELAAEKTLEDFQAWLADPRSPPPVSRSLGGVVLAEAGAEEGYFEVELTPGGYVLFCTINAPDGRTHTDHGMIQHFQVD
jgi:hypothetical protein